MNLGIRTKFKQILSSQRITKVGANLLPSTVAVLIYHDLSKDDDFPSWLRVKKSTFESHIGQLKKICNFVHPSDLFQKDELSNNRLNVLLTFDDGFVNQYALALPILQKFKVPALFFLSTENIETGEIFWFDRVVIPIQALRIENLDLRHLGLRNYHFCASDGARRWSDIQVLLEDIKSKGNGSPSKVKRIFEYFDNRFKDIIRRARQIHRPLTQDEVRNMKASNLCYFGSHSHRHEILTYLNDDEIRENLIKSREFLEKLLGEDIVHFAYPNGDTDFRVSKLCRECGYEYGYGTSSGLLRRNAIAMNIPRIGVGGYDSAQSLFWKINKELIRSVWK